MQIFLTKEAQKQYKHLIKSAQVKIKKKLGLLAQEPLAGKPLKGKLAELYSLRVWPYRVIYTIDKKQKEIWITTILH